MGWLKRVLCPPAPTDAADVVADADAKLGAILDQGRDQLEQTREIRRDLATVRRRMERAEFPFLGDGDSHAAEPGR